MTLSAPQMQAIEHGEAIELTIGGTHCVVLRLDIYQQAMAAAELSPRDIYPAVLKALDRFDDSPEQYLEYLNE